jgi:hypothetical protein
MKQEDPTARLESLAFGRGEEVKVQSTSRARSLSPGRRLPDPRTT